VTAVSADSTLDVCHCDRLCHLVSRGGRAAEEEDEDEEEEEEEKEEMIPLDLGFHDRLVVAVAGGKVERKERRKVGR
jgi:hypothetical protein